MSTPILTLLIPETKPIVLLDSVTYLSHHPPRLQQYAHSEPDTYAPQFYDVDNDRDNDDEDQNDDGNLLDYLQVACDVDTSSDIGLSSPNLTMATEEYGSFATVIRRVAEVLGFTLPTQEVKRNVLAEFLNPGQTSQEPLLILNEVLNHALVVTWAKPESCLPVK